MVSLVIFVALGLAILCPILLAAGYIGAYHGVEDEEDARELRQRLFFGTQFAWHLVPRWCGFAIVIGAACGLFAVVAFAAVALFGLSFGFS